MEDVTRGAYMCSLTLLLLRIIGSSSFASCGMITLTIDKILMLSDPLPRDPLRHIAHTGGSHPFPSHPLFLGFLPFRHMRTRTFRLDILGLPTYRIQRGLLDITSLVDSQI